MSAFHRSRSVVLAFAVAALVTACGGAGADSGPAPTPTPSPTETAPPPPPPPPPPVDPLTGVAPEPSSPLVAIKIDNAPLSRPFHSGLDSASITYLELVEGGATRLLSLFSQPPNGDVGPIRSLRESDVELLVQHGKAAVGFSGANSGVLGTFRAAVQAGQLVEVSYENRPDLYRIGERRRDAKNFYANPAVLARNAAGATPARDVGLVFGPQRPDARAAGSARVVFSDRETWDVVYDPASTRYRIQTGGVPLKGAAPANVVVQQVPVRGSGYRDVTGAVTPYTVTIGQGPVHVLRDGTVTTGTWQRPGPGSGTSLVAADGQPIPLKPGPTWILLQPQGLPFSTG